MKLIKFFSIATLFVALSVIFSSCEDKDVSNDKNSSIAWTQIISGTENGYEYVDLGLPSGLKWATCNVGATKPEESGDYFAWGETSPKSVYDWTTYKWFDNDSENFLKYNTDSYSGVVDNKIVLDSEDDAATVNMGGKWRMPTNVEQDELRQYCMWEWQGSKKAYKVTGPNGRFIFFPAFSYYENGNLANVGRYGNYWSSSLYIPTDTLNVRGYTLAAYELFFNSTFVDEFERGRCTGRSVRGVCE